MGAESPSRSRLCTETDGPPPLCFSPLTLLILADHLTPHARRSQLITLTYFLVEGGILPPSSTFKTDHLLTLEDFKSVSAETDDLVSGAKKIDGGLWAGGKEKDGWGMYVEKRYPLVIFSKSYCPYSRQAKNLIAQLEPSPAPLVIEVDLRCRSLDL